MFHRLTSPVVGTHITEVFQKAEEILKQSFVLLKNSKRLQARNAFVLLKVAVMKATSLDTMMASQCSMAVAYIRRVRGQSYRLGKDPVALGTGEGHHNHSILFNIYSSCVAWFCGFPARLLFSASG